MKLLGKQLFSKLQFITSSTYTKKTKCLENIIGQECKRKTIIQLDRVIQRKIKVDQRKSASSVKVEIETELGIIISEQTVRRRLHGTDFKSRVARKTSQVDKINRAKRIQYAKTNRDEPLGFWDQVLWTDKSKFKLFGSDGKLIVWRTPSEAFNPKMCCSNP